MSTIEKKENYDRLKLLYEEGWKQLVHEDQLVENRNRLYQAILAALTGFTGVVFSLLIKSENQDFDPYLLGAVLILSGFFLFLITINWSKVLAAGKKYSELRRVHLSAIEKLWEIDDVGLASVEHSYRQHIKKNKGSIFYLFPDIPELREFKIETDDRSESHTVLSQGTIFGVWVVISLVFFVFGCLLIFF